MYIYIYSPSSVALELDVIDMVTNLDIQLLFANVTIISL